MTWHNRGMVMHGMVGVCYGMAWEMVWHGMVGVWYGMAWLGCGMA